MFKNLSARNVLLCWVSLVMCCVSAHSAINKEPPAQELSNFSLDNKPAFQGLIEFAIENRIPIGIVLARNPDLCAPRKKLALKNVTAQKIVQALLQRSGYVWSHEDGIFLIKPKAIPATSEQILGLRYPRFHSPETTFQGVGAILSGYISFSLEPDQGYASSILSSSESTTLRPFTLENITVEQIANHVIGLGGKGVWILDIGALTR